MMSENTQSSAPQSAEGLLGSLKSLTALVVAITHNRLNLLSTDLEIAREQMVSVLMMVLVTLFCLCFGALLLALFVVVIFWDTHRLIALGSVTGVFILIGVVCLWRVLKALKAMPATFEASLAELAKDYKQLKSND
jgi:uncharacterized membrane protein YqjE